MMDIFGPEDISPPATPPNFNFASAVPSSSSSSSSTNKSPRSIQRHRSVYNDPSFAQNPAHLATVFNDAQLDHLRHLKQSFQQLSPQQQQYFLYEIINCCDNSQLAYLNDLIAPRLKIDFLKELPIEISLHVLSFIDDPKTLARAACVSTFWNSLLQDEATWKSLCMKHQYRRRNSSICGGELLDPPTQRLNFSYREYFKRKYNIASAWAQGGRVKVIADGFREGLVTSLQFDEKYIVVGCDNNCIEVFDTNTGKKIRTLEGHEGGVWALQFKGGENYDPERVLVSGGCDRDVRVWDLNSGRLRHVLRGHTSTVRCLKMKDKRLAVTGSRDNTMRVWDIQRGALLHVLLGHQASVRCLEIHGNTVVSGSYDFTARVWDIRTGQCLHVLVGHISQIYTIAFDGQRVVTGSLDSTIRVWSAETGQCLATLHGHTSLVGQLQLSGSTLVSGGSDGCLRVWDLQHYECVQQISAHDNSVTCLQFDDRRMVSAGNDGRIKLWDIKQGRLIRLFSQPAKTVWKIQFNDTKAVVLMQRRRSANSEEGKTVMEIHDFDVPDNDRHTELTTSISSSSSSSSVMMMDLDEDDINVY
ncbi:WD40-repeat-containing domain protein [Radiomyces spectabilis]|uniref:WD40-repeat-containing domain protein n=1 Tax=Radiomyces spectabilis TaxID=64574 RepID=UPI002220FA88|nr:WD40-repeat-containing domain protein [Radiomyces spectabilis]KAI8377800.1 WD40-repeat-containing domain protein [Radiomyces spectabilis]